MGSMLNKVVDIEVVRPFCIRVVFRDGTSGVHDCSHDSAGIAPIVLPLQEPTYFARVFLEHGAPTWPNGFDMCPDWLRMEMVAAGELTRQAAE